MSLSAGLAYYLLVRALMASRGQPPTLAEVIGRDVKGKISPLAYAVAIPIGLFAPLVALAIYVCVVLLWIVPDPRIERALRS